MARHGKGVVRVEDSLDTGPHRGHPGIGQGAFGIRGRQPRGDQQLVLLTGGHLQRLGQPQHHGPAGRRAAGLDEADVPGRHIGLQSEVELAEPSALPPRPHQRTERGSLQVDTGHLGPVSTTTGRGTIT